MYSSRMRTVHSSDRLSGGCLLPVGCLLLGGGLSAPGGGVCYWGVSTPGGVCSGGCLLLGGCLLPGRCLLSGVSAPGGCLLPEGVVWQTPPPPCGQTHACKNITFTTSLRTVKIFVIPVKGFLPANSCVRNRHAITVPAIHIC